MAARGGRKRLSGATAGGWCKGLDADKVRRLRGRLGQYFARRRAHMWFAAICARWGVPCTAQDGGRRAIFQATAARRQIQPRRAIFQATAHRASTSCDDKLRSDTAPIFKRQRIADRRHHATTIAVSLLRRGQCAGPYLSAQIQRGNVAAWTTRALRMASRPVPNALLALYRMPGIAMLFC